MPLASRSAYANQGRHMNFREAIAATFSATSVRRSALVMLIVGTTLNLINQGDALIHGRGIIWWKLVLSYVVPFAVASYGSYAAFRKI